MANIRFDNFSGDTVTVIFDGNEAVVENECRTSFDLSQKATHSLRIHRTRVPFESEDSHEATNGSGLPFKEEKAMHAQLDLLTELEINASKAVVTVKSDVTAKDKMGLNVIFSAYSVSATGAKIINERKVFASASVKKSFLAHHIKNSLFPVGVGGLAIFLLGLFAIISAIDGNPINLGGKEFTLPWAVGLSAIGSVFIGYAVICIVNILKTAKRLK